MFFIMMDSSGAKFQIDTASLTATRELLRPYLRLTPVLQSGLNANVFYKAENLQVTGSFKVRTAFSQLLRLAAGDAKRGIVTSSSGNFALATAYAGDRLGMLTKIVMMKSANPLKVARTKRYGGQVAFCEDRFESRAETVAEIVASEGRTEIAPYDHPFAVLGSTTIAAEIIEQFPAVENIVTPVSGGGLIAGIAAAAKLLKPGLRVWGVQPKGSNATCLSFRARDYRSIDKAVTVADGLMVTRPGRVTFPLILEHVDDVVSVCEAAILQAVCHLHEEDRLVVEPSGAVPLAAVIEGKIPRKNTVLVLSGGNIAPEVLRQAIGGG